MRPQSALALLCGLFLSSTNPAVAADKERIERFDADPQWEGLNNRAVEPKPRTIRQDFGYSMTKHAGGEVGEVGGLITPAAEAAFYGTPIAAKTLGDPLAASGKLAVTSRNLHVLIGFFNSATLNEWRTPNTIALRLLGRGDVFYAYVEYATSRWRAGGDSPGGFATVREAVSGRLNPRGFACGKPLEWSLRYDPDGNRGSGSITVTLGGETAICHLDAGHKADGARFSHFGLVPVLKSADDAGEMWLDDVTVAGVAEDFAREPKWEGRNNRRTYETAQVRPRFDFGYSPTQHAGGRAAGELGGLVFRGDCRHGDKLAAYGDRLSDLTLAKPLRASGQVALRRAVSDSTTLLGFYHSQDSVRVNPSQGSGIPESFLGMAIEGPSRDGFFLYPMYRVKGGGQGYGDGPQRPRILPDDRAQAWSLVYDPAAAAGRGRVTVTVAGTSSAIELGMGENATATRFDRFGILTTWIDGNGQHIFFDDLVYTCEQ